MRDSSAPTPSALSIPAVADLHPAPVYPLASILGSPATPIVIDICFIVLDLWLLFVLVVIFEEKDALPFFVHGL